MRLRPPKMMADAVPSWPADRSMHSSNSYQYKLCALSTGVTDCVDAHFWPALQKMDPQMRKLLEVTHEAWVDSGVDYRAMRGSARVGVYLGCCGSEVHAMWLSNYNDITGYEQTGCTMSMFANRLSFFFDFRGPSKAVDTGAALGSPACLVRSRANA